MKAPTGHPRHILDGVSEPTRFVPIGRNVHAVKGVGNRLPPTLVVPDPLALVIDEYGFLDTYELHLLGGIKLSYENLSQVAS